LLSNDRGFRSSEANVLDLHCFFVADEAPLTSAWQKRRGGTETSYTLAPMEQFLVQSENIEATNGSYVNLLGMTVEPSAEFKFPIYLAVHRHRYMMHLMQGGNRRRRRFPGASTILHFAPQV
jgi:hypothetical protein